MAYNRKMRKFEGTCYIPGEQLAMMAKYYRGANLNLNLTLFEEDLSTLQETLDQACWCSKLDEVDRMKMSHMKGNEWRIAHDHCLQQSQQGPDARNPKVYPALPQRSRSTVCKVERGTSAVSLYDRERGIVRGGRYQRDDYSEPRRDDYYDFQNRRDDYDFQNRRDGYYDFQNRRVKYDEPQNHRGYYSDPRSVRDEHDMRYRRDTQHGPSVFHAQVLQSEKRTSQNVGGPPDQRHDVESEPSTSMPETPGDIRCAVCNVETCLVCKHHLYNPICQCTCPVANAGLCNRCNQEPCEEEEQVPQETGGNKMDLSTMMLTMMMSSMFKQSQAPEPVCSCKPSRENSDSSPSDSSDGKVHKVYLYDCESTKKNKKPRKKSKKGSSESSSSCNYCCKCSRKSKKNSIHKEKPSKTEDEETSESDEGQKRQTSKGKDTNDGNRISKGREGSLESDKRKESKESKESNGKSTLENHKPNKGSKEDDVKSVISGSMKSMKMKNENVTFVKQNNGEIRGSKAQESSDNNVQFSNTKKNSPKKRQKLSSSESDVSKRGSSPRNSPPAQRPLLLCTQRHLPDRGSFNHSKKDGDAEGFGAESSTTFGLKELIVSLPKIQSNLQSLMHKLNQMDHLNNKLQYPRIDPTSGGTTTRPDIPLISSPQNPLQSLCNERPQLYNPSQRGDSDISIGFSPGNLPMHHLPPTNSTGTTKDEKTVHTPLNPPTRYHSIVNFPSLGERPQLIKATASDWKQVHRASEVAESANRTFEFSPLGGRAFMKDNIDESGNQWSFKKKNHIAHLSPPFTLPYIHQNSPQSKAESEHITSKTYCRKRPDEILEYTKACGVNENAVHPMPNAFSPGNFLHNIEIIELPEMKSYNKCNYESPKYGHEVSKGGTAGTTSQHGGETIFQSYNQESSSEQDLTYYASFTDQKHFQPSPASSAQQATNNSQNNRERRTLDKTRSVLKPGGLFKAKLRNPVSFEKLVQGCTVRGSTGSQRKSNVNMEGKVDSSGRRQMKLHDQGVGPGKFHRSQSDSSLDYSSRSLSEKNAAGKNNKVIPLKNKRLTSPIKEKATKKNSLLPKMHQESSVLGKISFKNVPSDWTADQSDSILKMSDAYVRQEVGSQSYILSSVEVKTMNNYRSSTDILKMLQGIASSSHTNVSSVPSQTAPTSSDDFDTLPLLPLSTTPTDGSVTRSENQPGAVIAKKQVSFDDEVNPNPPAFLRKSRVQVEQLKRAHETIRSMIKNVNDVIAHIDSDSKIGIRSKARSEDNERQSDFVPLGDDGNSSHYKPHMRTDPKQIDGQFEAGDTSKPACFSDNREIQKMFSSIDRVLNAVLTPSDQSNVTPEDRWPSETPSRAQRGYFILNSDSSSTAFTESLRRSLENDTSRSLPLATQPVPSPQQSTSQRPTSTRPLKQRSWFPPPKK